RGVAHRHRALAQAGLGAHALADAERGREEAVGHRAGRLGAAGLGVRVLYLPEDLRLADDERVEAGGDAKQVVGGLLAAVDDDVRRQPLPGDAVELADEAAEGVGRRLALGAGVDLRAVASRQHDHFVGDLALGDRGQRRLHALPGEVDALPQLNRRRAVGDPYG